MSVIREIRSWFLSASSSGNETKFNKTYTKSESATLVGKVKMFLKGNYPSADTFGKLFRSVPFFLDKDSTAFEKKQGLVQKATDAKILTRDSSSNGEFNQVGTNVTTSGVAVETISVAEGDRTEDNPGELSSSHFVTAVLPHQIPEVALTNGTIPSGYTDVAQTSSIHDGLILTGNKRTGPTPATRYRQVYKLGVNVDDSSIKIVSNALATNGVTTTFDLINSVTYNSFGQVTEVRTGTLVFTKGVLTSYTPH